MAGKRIPQLPAAATTAKQGVFAIVDPITDQTVQIEVQKALGATRASFAWQVGVTYDTGDFVLYQGLTTWRSLVDSNISNVPTENSFWTTEPISVADGITDTQHANGLFTYDDSKVIYLNAQYFLQVAAPYKSTDIAAEIIAGDWADPALGIVDDIDFSGNQNGYLNRRVNWDENQKCPAYFNDISASRHQIGRELWKRAINRTGGTLLNGKAIKAGPTDVTTELPTAVLAGATDVDIADIIGFLTHDVDDDGECEIVPFGDVNDIDTSLLSEGAIYLSTTAGEVTNTPPLSPDAIVLMGRAEVIDASTGRIYANVNQAIFPESIPLNASWSAFSGSITGPNYVHGYYTFESAITPGAGQTMGTANIGYGAHVYFVLGATSTDMVIRVSGTSYNDTTGRTASDFEDVDTSGAVLDDYIETAKKFIGQVNITLQSGTGVTTEYGWSKYWDNQNARFVGTGFEWIGRAGANDSGPNISLIHHKPIGWTYTGSGAIPPAPILDMQTQYVTEFQVANGENFAYKVLGITDVVKGELNEGIIIQIDITSNNAVSASTITFNKIG